VIDFIKNSSERLSRLQKQLILILIDIVLICFSFFVSISLHGLEITEISYFDLIKIISVFLLSILPLFIISGLYRAVLKYIGSKTITAAIKSITIAVIIVCSYALYFKINFDIRIFFIFWFILIFNIIAVRYFANKLIYRKKESMSIAIYGAGEAGVQLSNSLRSNEKYNLKCFFDDDKLKVGMIINSKKIYHSMEIKKKIDQLSISIILLAIPSLGKLHRKKILNELALYPIRVMELPGINNLIDEKVTIDDIKTVQVEQILDRDTVKPIKNLLYKNVKNKNIMVTGAGGSIGSEICRQLTKYNPKSIVLLDHSEYSLYKINDEICNLNTNINIKSILGSIQNFHFINDLFEKNVIDTIYHAAAYKHVPLIEENIYSGVLNNILGTYNLAKAAQGNNVKNFVFVSTDKAVKPSSIMGSTKRISEIILQSMFEDNKDGTVFTTVRFGNVLDSAGSVIPLFRKQIKNGGPLTVTHKNMYRYFMSIPEAVQLVIQAGAMSKGGDIFVLDMGQEVNIYELAKKMIHLSGLKISSDSQKGDIEIKIVGLRRGEKLREELIINKNKVSSTDHPKIIRTHEPYLGEKNIDLALEDFKNCLNDIDDQKLKVLIKEYLVESTI